MTCCEETRLKRPDLMRCMTCLERFTIIDTTRGAKSHHANRGPEWWAWIAMKQRCYNPNHEAYERYGGRGITVCERWLESFANFYEDMGPRPPTIDGVRVTLEREDNDGIYEATNCVWATYQAQADNRRPESRPRARKRCSNCLTEGHEAPQCYIYMELTARAECGEGGSL